MYAFISITYLSYLWGINTSLNPLRNSAANSLPASLLRLQNSAADSCTKSNQTIVFAGFFAPGSDYAGAATKIFPALREAILSRLRSPCVRNAELSLGG
jgi:hypothetical protein